MYNTFEGNTVNVFSFLLIWNTSLSAHRLSENFILTQSSLLMQAVRQSTKKKFLFLETKGCLPQYSFASCSLSCTSCPQGTVLLQAATLSGGQRWTVQTHLNHEFKTWFMISDCDRSHFILTSCSSRIFSKTKIKVWPNNCLAYLEFQPLIIKFFYLDF